MSTLHIKPYGANELGFPVDFPLEVREGAKGEPPAGWFALPRADYDAYVDARRHLLPVIEQPPTPVEEREPTIEDRLAVLQTKLAAAEAEIASLKTRG